MIFRSVPSIDGLECTADGLFRYNGKPKKVVYSHRNTTGQRLTAKITIRIGGKNHYWQASKLVAKTWLRAKYTDYITYKDGNCHNIKAENLELADENEYSEYIRRNSVYRADTLEERKRKLQLVIDEATMTLNYFNTLDFAPINKHVQDYLYPCLMQFCIKTLQFGERKSMDSVTETIGYLYERLTDGMCIYNYERFCKQRLHHLKKTGRFGEYWHSLCKPIKIEVEQLNLDCLWERYKVTKQKK